MGSSFILHSPLFRIVVYLAAGNHLCVCDHFLHSENDLTTILERKQRNPNPFPIGIRFGFLKYGGTSRCKVSKMLKIDNIPLTKELPIPGLADFACRRATPLFGVGGTGELDLPECFSAWIRGGRRMHVVLLYGTARYFADFA